jgi:hypothetical protein
MKNAPVRHPGEITSAKNPATNDLDEIISIVGSL